MKRVLGLFFAVALGAQSAVAAEGGILAKIGGDFDTRSRDRELCRHVAADANTDELPGMEPVAMASGAQGGGYAVAGAAIANLLFLAVAIDHGRTRAVAFCLRNLGYEIAPLTPVEAAAYASLTGAARDAFERTFLAQDLAPRLTPLLTPTVPPLPPFAAGPGVQGGLKIDLSSLKAADQPVAEGEVAVSGAMARWRTAVLESPLKSPSGKVMVAAGPGAVFHQVDYRPQRAPLLRTQGATWCGPVRQTTATTSGVTAADGAEELYCFTSQADGYDVFHPGGFAWLAGPYRSGFVLPRLTDPIVLRERDQDDLGSIGVEIRVATVTRDRVTLEGKAVRNGKSVDLWSRRLAFDASGQAILPLWSRRLIIRRSGGRAVTASVDDRGDGHGWREGD